MPEAGVRSLLEIGVEIVENSVPGVDIVHQPVERADDHADIHVVVVRQELTDFTQRQALFDGSFVAREHAAAEAPEGGVVGGG